MRQDFDRYGYAVSSPDDQGHCAEVPDNFNMSVHNCATAMDIAEMQCQCGKHFYKCDKCGEEYNYNPRDCNSRTDICPDCDRDEWHVDNTCHECTGRASHPRCTIFPECPLA